MKIKLATITRTKTGKPNIKIMFSFDWDLVSKMKTLPNHRYNGNDQNDKHWICTLCVEAVKSLQGWGFELDEELRDFVMSKKLNVQSLEELEVPRLKMQLYPFQKKGVAFIEAKGGRALVGDEMGLGKTATALAWLQLHPEIRPAVVVVPASLKLNWQREAEKWMQDPHVQILYGVTPNFDAIIGTQVNLTDQIIILNYDILSAWTERLQSIKPQVLILDEVHYTKNSKAKRTQSVKRLAKHIPHVIALSGTPIINRPMEFYNTIKLIDPTIVSSKWDFAFKYCGARWNGFGWDFTGATNTEELHALLTNTIMIRRKKEHVLGELPPKTRAIVPIELDNVEEYSLAEADFLSWIGETKGKEAARRASNAEAFTKVEVLKQVAVKGKMTAALQWIGDFLDSGEKLVTFSTHTATVDALMGKFGEIAVRIDGSVTGEVRDRAVQRFQNDSDVKLFVGNIKAAGVGLNLTAASSVAFLELGWSPGEHDQAEDRVYARLSDLHGANIYYLIAVGTIEEKVARLLDYKRKIVNKVLDGIGTEDESLLGQLLKEYKKRGD